ncbi:MAG: hypothetical protein JW806_10605 [Sedimentisphaerales bacterium]|nr:hypothetical protein [Sedimentisphaerales bacterium]
MKKICIYFVIIALFCPIAFCDIKTITRQTKGQGVNREEAIKHALYQAVAQTKGVKVSTKDESSNYRSASADIEGEGASIKIDAVSVQAGSSDVKTEVIDLVKTYEMLNEKKIDDETYEVALKVWVYNYEPPHLNNRPKLAVMPVKTLKPQYQFGEYISSDDISSMVSHKLSTGFTETNKYAVLDREYVTDFAKNKGIILSDSEHSIEEQAKLGKTLGADYMFSGTVTDLRLETRDVFLKAIGRETKEYEADFAFDYRLMVASTRQIVVADSVKITLKTKAIKKLIRKWDPKNLDHRELLEKMISQAVNQVVSTVIDKTYPIRIAAVEKDGKIIINQGGRRISKGLVLDVYTQGKEITDIDTKESLGRMETSVASIKINEVAQNIACAELVEGALSNISTGMICRYKIEPDKREGAKSKAKITPEGGVNLPFD